MEDDETLKLESLEEIETIRNIIHRLANSSFIIKGWAVAVFIISLLLSRIHYLVFIVALAVLLFWYLDAHFLRQETMYKVLYKEIVEHELNTGADSLDVRTARYEAGLEIGRPSKLMLSKTLLFFYGSILFLTLAYAGLSFAVSNG